MFFYSLELNLDEWQHSRFVTFCFVIICNGNRSSCSGSNQVSDVKSEVKLQARLLPELYPAHCYYNNGNKMWETFLVRGWKKAVKIKGKQTWIKVMRPGNFSEKEVRICEPNNNNNYYYHYHYNIQWIFALNFSKHY